MKTVKVTYTTTEAFAEQNQANIRQVMQDLQNQKHPDIFYHVLLQADGKSFMHTAFFKSMEAEQDLFKLPSFQHFQQALKASGPEAAPKQEAMSLVGASEDIF